MSAGTIVHMNTANVISFKPNTVKAVPYPDYNGNNNKKFMILKTSNIKSNLIFQGSIGYVPE